MFNKNAQFAVMFCISNRNILSNEVHPRNVLLIKQNFHGVVIYDFSYIDRKLAKP